VRLQRRVTSGCKSRQARALGSVTEGNCVAARRGGEQLEVKRRSATEVNPIRLVHVASLLPRGEARTRKEARRAEGAEATTGRARVLGSGTTQK
jgi:hypothetical protein